MTLPMEMRQNYIQRRKKDIESLSQALANNDFSTIQTIGHQLKGNGVTYGFPQVSAIGIQMEEAGKEGDKEAAEKSIHLLTQWLEKIRV